MKNQKQRLASWYLDLAGLKYSTSDTPADAAPALATPGQKVHRRFHHWLFLSLFLSSFLVFGWLVVGSYATRFNIGSAGLSTRSTDPVLKSSLESQAAAYKLTVAYPDGHKKDFGPKDMGLSVDVEATLRNMRRAEQSFGPRLMWWRPIRVAARLHGPTTVLNGFIQQNATVTLQPPQDAMLKLNNGKVELVNSSIGRQYGLSRPDKTLVKAVSSWQTEPLKLQILAIQPQITVSQLNEQKALLEKTLSQPINLTIGDTVVKPNSGDIADWLEITPNPKTKKLDITPNSGKILAYISKGVAPQTQSPRTQVEVVEADGTVKVVVAGHGGSDLQDKQALATQIADKLLAGKGLSLDMSLSRSGFKTVRTAEHAKWIEVDLTHKKLYAYENTELVKSFGVTAGAPATPTVTGQFAIYAKYSQQDMRGHNADGSNYFQPKVPWVNYFYKDYAIHGNYWRPLSYFGNINSSHGCVSTVTGEAEWIYSWAPVGTTVLVHI
ncbi:MAG TPA: L,D-transpeptidase family protein [Candidatus Saccharimonadales bacterium]|nr:L,D-transpeptidase family protein [Candidatus Saccharimonadales bacterium]